MERFWLDTNVILRFLTREPEGQYERSVSLVQQAERGEVELFVDDLILAESLWTLQSFYGYSTREITDVLIDFLSIPGVRTPNTALSTRALRLTSEKNVDFIDACLALRADAAGEKVITFDKTDFSRLPAEWSEPT